MSPFKQKNARHFDDEVKSEYGRDYVNSIRDFCPDAAVIDEHSLNECLH